MAPRGRRPERGIGYQASTNSAAPNSNRDLSGNSRGQEETSQQRRARANRINSTNWRQFAVVPSQGDPASRPTLDQLIRESFRLISPASAADAAATALRNRGLPVPGEESTTAALFQNTGDYGNQIAASGASTTAANANQAITALDPAGPTLVQKDNPDGSQSNRVSISPVKKVAANSSKPQSHRSLPPLSPAGPVPAHQPTGRSIPDRGRTPIAATDLLTCNQYYTSNHVGPIRVETGIMACVVYSDPNELNVYARQELPHDPCMDDILIVISKTIVAFARIPGDLDASHTLENCCHFQRLLGPWLNTSESVTVYALSPRNSVCDPWYATEKKQLRLNTVYANMHNYAKNRGSFIFDSYYPTGSRDIECSISVRPVADEDTLAALDTASPLSGDLGLGQGDCSSGFGANLDFAVNSNNNDATTNTAIDRAPGQNDLLFVSTDTWPGIGSIADSSALNQGAWSINNETGFGATQNVPSQTQGFLISPFDQSHAEELGFYVPGSPSGYDMNAQQRNTMGQGAHGQTTYDQNTYGQALSDQGVFGQDSFGQNTLTQGGYGLPSFGQQQTRDPGILGLHTYDQSQNLDLSTQVSEVQNASRQQTRTSSTDFPISSQENNMIDLTTKYLGPQGYFGGQGNNNNENPSSTGSAIGSHTNLLATSRTFGLDVVSDRTPRIIGRPRVVIRDRLGERIL